LVWKGQWNIDRVLDVPEPREDWFVEMVEIDEGMKKVVDKGHDVKFLLLWNCCDEFIERDELVERCFERVMFEWSDISPSHFLSMVKKSATSKT